MQHSSSQRDYYPHASSEKKIKKGYSLGCLKKHLTLYGYHHSHLNGNPITYSELHLFDEQQS